MEIESTRIFVKVVQLGSFTKAAELLKLPKSTVSRTVSRLETEAGTKLILRTTRSMTLTPAGQVFYENCLGPVQALEDARKSLEGKDSLIAGLIRLTAPEDLGIEIISTAVGVITRENSEINFELNYTDEVIDLVKEGYDIAIRVGKLSPSRYKSRRLGEIKTIMVTSPKYIKQKGMPKKPQDLSGHDCISFNLGSMSHNWALYRKGTKVSISNKPRILANQMSSLLKLVHQGAGIGLLPWNLCKDAIASGALIHILPEWEGPGYPVSIVTPPGYSNSSRVRFVSEHLAKAIQAALK